MKSRATGRKLENNVALSLYAVYLTALWVHGGSSGAVHVGSDGGVTANRGSCVPEANHVDRCTESTELVAFLPYVCDLYALFGCQLLEYDTNSANR